MVMKSHIVLFFLLLCHVSTEALENTFINPPGPGEAGDYTDNPAWPLYSTQAIQWTTNFSSYYLWIYQDDGHGSGESVQLSRCHTIRSHSQSLTFSVRGGFQLGTANYQFSLECHDSAQFRHYACILATTLQWNGW